jgi:hypothetical protein
LDDVLFHGHRRVSQTPGGEGVYQDVTVSTELLTYGSMRPIHQLCLEAERLQMARALYIIHRLSEPERVISIHVDGVYLQPTITQRKKLKEVFANLTYSDLPNLQTRFEEPDVNNYLLDRAAQLYRPVAEAPSNSQDSVYKFIEQEADGSSVQPKLPGGKLCVEEVPAPEFSQLEWLVNEEPSTGEDDFYERVIKPHVVEQQKSGLFEAPPGFGKTHVLKQLKVDLEAAGHKVAMVALCHVACRNLGPGAQTLHSFCHKHVLHGTFQGWVLIDEISQVSLQLAACLEKLELSGCKLVCFGDRLQLGPIMPTWRGKSVDGGALINSRLLKLWCDCTVFKLTRYRRGVDYAFCKWFIRARGMEAGVAIKDALEKFPPQPGPVDWNLCLSHNRRKHVNQQAQEAAAAEYRRVCPNGLVVRVEPSADTKSEKNEAQPYDLFVGTRLIGCNSDHAHIVNGALLDVIGLTTEKATLRDIEIGEEFELTLGALFKHTRLRHAITIAACQGRTIPARTRLYDVGSPFFSTTHLYVAASRCTSGAMLQVMPNRKRPREP